MPDAPSPFDDPFADLFGKLPDPRSADPCGDDAARGTSTPDAPACRPTAGDPVGPAVATRGPRGRRT